jgi:hypothetical protein
MRRWLWLSLSLLLIEMAVSRDVRAGDPELEFRTLHTEHFNVHYHQGLERTARTVASLCEEVYVDLSILFGWEVDGAIEVVITDSTDSSNGSASVLGRPVIRLYATAPDIDTELQSYDHWMRSIITHEYTHIVQLSIHGRVSDVINSIFGDVYFPGQMAPNWLIEGLAVLVESEETSMGRLRSSIYHMYVRTAALEGTLLDLGQVSNSARQYPHGGFSYLYGAFFMKYIRDKFGWEKVTQIYHRYGKSVLPYGVNRTFEETLGQGVMSLYDEWVASLKKESEALRAKLEKQGLTESRAVTTDGESKGQPVFGEDNESVYMAIGNGIEESSVFHVPLDGGKPEPIFLAPSRTRIAMDRASRIYYTRTAPHRSLYFYNDIFVSDTRGTDPVRLTDGLRATHVAVSPRGDRLAATVNDAGTTKLVLLDDRGHRLASLIDSAPDDQVYEPVWSPDGKQVAALVRRGPDVDVATVDLEKGTLRFITRDRFQEKNLAYGPGGRYLVFASDRTGINNLYAFDFETEKLLQLTNVLTGAFAPAVSKDGKKLAFLLYSSIGYDLHVMPFSPETAPEAGAPWTTFGPVKETPPPVRVASREYNPFPTFLPTHWELNTSFDADWNATLQAVTAFSDVAGRHRLGLDLAYNTADKVASGQVGYSFSGLGPRVHFGFSRRYVPRDTGYFTGTRDRDWLQVITQASVNVSFPILVVDSSHGLTFGYSIVHAKPREKPTLELDPRGEIPTVPTQYFRAGLSMGWSYSDSVSSPLGIAPHRGRHVSARVNLNHPALGGDQTLATFTYGWVEYLKMPWLKHHTMSLSVSGGVYLSNPPNEAAFRVGGYSELNEVDTIINNTSAGTPSLRGYPPDAFEGSRLQSFRLTYWFPIWHPELAYGTVPLFLKTIYGSVFTDNVLISFDDFDRDDWRSSLGALVGWTFSLGYYQTMRLSTGYAHGFMKGGTHEIILVLSGGG